MKKNVYLLIMFILGMHIIQAKPVTPVTAKNVAISFYKQHSAKVPQTLALAYTETSPSGEALYYVFNVNTNDGFVIITADDVAHPIIGYSTENQFVIPEGNTNFEYWMNSRKNEIMAIKAAANLQATEDITREWAGNFITKTNASNRNGNNANTVSTYSLGTYLVQSTWNQSGGGSGTSAYNGYCPGGSVTGCVATCMAQIMRFWSYPTKGIGTSSYCDCNSTCTPTAGTYSMCYGTLTANYGTTTYSWSAMPLTSSNTKVATLMQNLGVSVDMNYAPGGSGAYVLAADNAICSQNSYTSYFGYDASTIQGYERTLNIGYALSGYTDTQWLNFIETDIAAGRPVQYCGYDPSQGGHTWVCDGYDASNNLHMNWGWGGSSDGWFTINNLNTGFNPTANHQILVGIQLPPTLDAGITGVVAPNGIICVSTFTPVVTLRNYGQNKLTTCNITYQIDGGTVLTYSWTGSLFTNQTINVSLPAVTTTLGTHTLTSATGSPNHGTDANTANDQSAGIFLYAIVGFAPPLVEGFEGSANLPANWSTSQAANDIPWQVVTNVGRTGSNCVGFNDCTGDAFDMTGYKEWLYTPPYDFSSASSASLSFDVGYVPAYDSVGAKLYTDSLAVLYSIDCGTTWNQIYYKGGVTLATAPSFTLQDGNCITPTSSQWRTETTNLTGVLGHNNVKFAFKNISDYGNWIFVDNINITSVNTTGIASVANKAGISIYPNPAHTNLFINITENTSSISVTDIIGQTVVAEQKVGTQQVQNIDISNLADGVYLVKVMSSDNQVKVLRFIKN